MITTAPGDEGQVDCVEGPIVRYPRTGKYRRTRLFVLTLGCSRKSVRLLLWHSSAPVWAELHERACRRLGGTVKLIVLDTWKRAYSRRTSTNRPSIVSTETSDASVRPTHRPITDRRCARRDRRNQPHIVSVVFISERRFAVINY